jgi:hypothetical protein
MRCDIFRGLGVVLLVIPFSAAWAGEAQRAMRVFELGSLPDDSCEDESLPPGPILGTRARFALGRDAGADPGFLSREDTDGLQLHASVLESVIREMIDPESWSNQRNSIEAIGSRLAIVQTPEVLDRIDRFLSDLEARAGRFLAIDLALVPPEALEKASPGALRPGAPPWLEGAAFDQIVSAAGADASVMSTTTRAGDTVTFEPPSTSLHVGDYEANQTGIVPVIHPVVGARREGAFAEAVTHVAPGGGWLRVDLRIGRASSREHPERKRFIYGDLDLPRERRIEVRTSMTVPEGKTAIAGIYSMSVDGSTAKGAEAEHAPSFAAIIRVRADLRAVESPPVPGIPHAFDVSALVGVPPDSRLIEEGPRWEDGAKDDEPSSVVSPEVLLETLEGLFPQDATESGSRLHFSSGSIFLRGSAEEAQRMKEHLEALAWDRGRPVAIDLWQGMVMKAELSGAGTGALLDRSWIDRIAARPGLRARILGAKGRSLSLASVSTRSYVGDLHMVSGGTGFKIATVGDPIIRVAGDGLLLDASSAPVAGTPWVQARIRGELARPPTFGREARTRASHDLEPERAGEKPGARPAGEWVTLELPDEDVDRWEHLVTAPQGQPVLLNVLPDSSEPGATRVLILTVTEFGLDGKPAQEGRL